MWTPSKRELVHVVNCVLFVVPAFYNFHYFISIAKPAPYH